MKALERRTAEKDTADFWKYTLQDQDISMLVLCSLLREPWPSQYLELMTPALFWVQAFFEDVHFIFQRLKKHLNRALLQEASGIRENGRPSF